MCCANAPDAAKAFEKMTEKRQPQKIWSDKETEFKGAFKNLASETKSAFAERNIRSLKNIMYKHMENKWTYHYFPICQHNQLTREVGLKQSYNEARATFMISSCRAVKQICQKIKV